MVQQQDIGSFEAVLAEYGADSRLEASITFPDLIRALEAAGNLQPGAAKADDSSASSLNDLPVHGELLTRDGLGCWRVLPIEVEKLGTIWIGVPEGEARTGVSMWYLSREMSAGQVATLVSVLTKTEDILFMDPDSGELVEKAPDPQKKLAP
ncbi:hypothetical protein ACXN5S_11665 [Pseudoroseicyclus sp. H15]